MSKRKILMSLATLCALAARFAGSWADTAITVAALVFYATPLFWVALMAILLFFSHHGLAAELRL